MQARELKRLDRSLEGFLPKRTAGLGRSERRRWAGVDVRGLLLDGERKSIEPMASRLGESDQDLQHFVSLSPWSADDDGEPGQVQRHLPASGREASPDAIHPAPIREPIRQPMPRLLTICRADCMAVSAISDDPTTMLSTNTARPGTSSFGIAGDPSIPLRPSKEGCPTVAISVCSVPCRWIVTPPRWNKSSP